MFTTIITRDYDLFEGICILLDREGKYWVYYETDPDWWALRLWIRKN
ncbi:hypothetical protein ES708_28213 [subsurface metagenome]